LMGLPFPRYRLSWQYTAYFSWIHLNPRNW